MTALNITPRIEILFNNRPVAALRLKSLKANDTPKEKEYKEEAITHHVFYPEMEQEAPKVDIIFNIGWNSKRRLKTMVNLKKGRGIKFVSTNKEGRHTYDVTELAFEKIKKSYSTAYEADL